MTTMWATGCGSEIAGILWGSSGGDIARHGSKSRGIYARHYDNPDITREQAGKSGMGSYSGIPRFDGASGLPEL